jgi:hypothetical protein
LRYSLSIPPVVDLACSGGTFSSVEFAPKAVTILDMKTCKLSFALFVLLFFLFPLTALAAMNLLANSGLNDPFTDIPGRVWNGQNEKIASGWQPFYVAGNTYQGDSNAKKLHWMSSQQFGATFGGLDYHIEGNRSQNMWSAYQFEAGIYQQIPVAANRAYGFDMAMVTYWRGPGYPDSDGKMVKQVGLDPYGGADPTSPNIVWSDPDANDKAWVYLDVGATALNTTITVFAKVQAPENTSVNHTDLDMVYFEAAHLAEVPTTTLTAIINGTTVGLTWTPGIGLGSGWSLKGYEVQYKDQAGGNWVTLQSKTGSSQNGSFSGQGGHTYTVRARTWQRTSERYDSDIDMPGPWQEKTVTVGGLVAGKVTTNQGTGVGGITVSEIGGSPATTTDSQGNYQLGLASAGAYTFTVSGVTGWTAPPPVAVSVQVNHTSSLNFTLRPPDDIISNGDFENDWADDWQVSGTPPQSVSSGQRSGAASLRLTNNVTLSQSGLSSGSYQPVLSFWYKIEGSDGDDSLAAELLDAASLTPVNRVTFSSNTDWRQAYLPLALTEVYTGPLGVRFSLAQTGPTQATVYLDEVSLGASWGGPIKAYLPVIVR